MSEYTRPAVEARDFRDESGAVIPYGARWTGSPPDGSYSRVSNPERFAPLHTVADALIEHLRAAYRVDVAALADSELPAATKAVAVTPARGAAGPWPRRSSRVPPGRSRARAAWCGAEFRRFTGGRQVGPQPLEPLVADDVGGIIVAGTGSPMAVAVACLCQAAPPPLNRFTA